MHFQRPEGDILMVAVLVATQTGDFDKEAMEQ
jgi:hypothetical protein